MKLKSLSPHDQSVVGEIEVVNPSQLKQLVANSHQALKIWRNTPIEERVSYLKKYQTALIKSQDELAKLISKEMGKPITQSGDEIAMELEYLEYYLTKGPEVLKNKIIRQDQDATYMIKHEPYGVFACIAPWNFPLTMFHTGVIPALLAGNTVLFKPSELSSLSQVFVAKLLRNTGLPTGVLEIVVGGKDVGAALLEEDINAVWFTGSTAVGKKIYAKAAQKFIKALLEMGGNSPAIVFNDVDIESAVENIFWGRFLANGQVCNADKRLYVQSRVYDKFLEAFKQRVEKATIGNPLEKATEIGPLVSKPQLENVLAQLADAVNGGAQVVTGGDRPKGQEFEHGNYLLPTILTNVNEKMEVMRDEVFGPILPIVKFNEIAEVISLANDSIYGLSAEIYTRDHQLAEQVANDLQVGTVGINTSNYFKPECPFGGYKLSGLGREYGEEGFLEFTQTKTIAVYNK